MIDRSVLIRVPATVGNFGGAASCAALALDAFLNARASTRRDGHVGVRYFGENGERVPRDSSNLAVRAMQAALESRGLPFLGVDFEMYGSVPVGMGLGSSTAAVWAGLLAADRLYRLNLGEKSLFELAGTLEPRGDNLRAAWLGGFVARFQEGPSQVYRSTVVPADLVLRVIIPEISSHGSSTDTVPGLDEVLRIRTSGTEAVFVCGSGPSIGILAHGDDPESAAKAAVESLASHGIASKVARFRPAAGARDMNAGGTEVRLAPLVGLDMPGHPSLPV
jgi:homoserine kinase